MAVPRQTATPVSFATLADNLQAVWTAPTTDRRLKKRIVRTLIHEVIADIDADASQIADHSLDRWCPYRIAPAGSTANAGHGSVKQLANDDIIAGILK